MADDDNSQRSQGPAAPQGKFLHNIHYTESTITERIPIQKLRLWIAKTLYNVPTSFHNQSYLND